MPYTVWSSFEAFRRNSVDLDPKQTDTARRSRDNLKSILENCEDKDSTFPTLTKRYLDFGSFARKTKVIEIDDIDMMVILNGKDTYEYQSNGEPYQRLLRIKESTAPLAKFNDGYNFVSSIKILNNIRDSLNLRYTKASIHRRQQAVTLDLSSYPWVFDIVPAVAVEDTYKNIIHYLIPDGKGEWMRTDPRIDATRVTTINQQHGGNILPLIRLLKYWNINGSQPTLPSYYFENLVLTTFKYQPKITSLQQAIYYFFSVCKVSIYTQCPDPKSLGPNLDADILNTTKQQVETAMAQAAASAYNANYYESQSNHQNAIFHWRQVFGAGFPNYG